MAVYMVLDETGAEGHCCCQSDEGGPGAGDCCFDFSGDPNRYGRPASDADWVNRIRANVTSPHCTLTDVPLAFEAFPNVNWSNTPNPSDPICALSLNCGGPPDSVKNPNGYAWECTFIDRVVACTGFLFRAAVDSCYPFSFIADIDLFDVSDPGNPVACGTAHVEVYEVPP